MASAERRAKREIRSEMFGTLPFRLARWTAARARRCDSEQIGNLFRQGMARIVESASGFAIRSGGKKNFDGWDVFVADGAVKGRDAMYPRLVGVGLVLQEQTNGMDVLARDGLEQRKCLVVIHYIGIGSLVEQRINNLNWIGTQFVLRRPIFPVAGWNLRIIEDNQQRGGLLFREWRLYRPVAIGPGIRVSGVGIRAFAEQIAYGIGIAAPNSPYQRSVQCLLFRNVRRC